MTWKHKTPEIVARLKRQQTERYHTLKKEAPFKHKCLYVKSAAKRKGLSFDLTPEYLENIWTGLCSISKTPIHLYNHRNAEDHAELDRIDSSKGYTQDNVHWTARKWNRMKGSLTYEDLIILLNWFEFQYKY